jgi:exodeoxyribonuclease VII large subunit
VYNSRIPVISAVGHETDYTIIDFVADLRAPTPSAAAELATPDIDKIKAFLTDCESRISRALSTLVSSKRRQLEICLASSVMKNPMSLTENKAQLLDTAVRDLKAAYERTVENRFNLLREYSYKLTALNPVATLSRGFAKVTKGGELVKKVSDVKINDEITVTVTDGDIKCVVGGSTNAGKEE